MTEEQTPVSPRRCTGCGRCVAVCPLRSLSLETVGFRKQVLRDRSRTCPPCDACAVACAFGIEPADQ